MTKDDDNLTQAMHILDELGSVPYTITEADVSACRSILRQLIMDDDVTGGYSIGKVQAYQGKAQVMVEFAKRCDAMRAGEIAARTADSAARLGTICRKVIAHYDTNHDRLAKLEEFYAASKEAARYQEEDRPEEISDRLYDAQEALG